MVGKLIASSGSLSRDSQISRPVLNLLSIGAPLPSSIRARGYKTFFVLNSVEHEISNAHKYKNIKKFSFCQAQISGECYFSCSTIVGILTFMSRKNFMLN